MSFVVPGLDGKETLWGRCVIEARRSQRIYANVCG